MSIARDCPKCRLINPPDAQRCDCGYDFVSRSVESSFLGKRDPHEGDLTLAETALVLGVPLFGVIVGLMNRSQGRRQAGNKMIIASLAMILVPVLILALFLEFGR